MIHFLDAEIDLMLDSGFSYLFLFIPLHIWVLDISALAHSKISYGFSALPKCRDCMHKCLRCNQGEYFPNQVLEYESNIDIDCKFMPLLMISQVLA